MAVFVVNSSHCFMNISEILQFCLSMLPTKRKSLGKPGTLENSLDPVVFRTSLRQLDVIRIRPRAQQCLFLRLIVLIFRQRSFVEEESLVFLMV